jgi:hypothetical protein
MLRLISLLIFAADVLSAAFGRAQIDFIAALQIRNAFIYFGWGD